MTTPQTILELDEQTQDDLWPPCDVYRFTIGPNPPCERPAAWIFRFAEQGSFLVCDGCKQKCIDEYRRTPPSSIERLR